MTEDRSARGGSSTSRPKRSHGSSRSDGASFTSTSSGSPLGAAAIRDLAERYGVHPSKTLGQNFLLDPNLAVAIVRDGDVQPGDRVVEIGAGLGSLTVALAAAGADVLAIEFDRGLVPALEEVVAPYPSVKVLHADATKLDWPMTLGSGPWIMCANLPYNVGTSIVMDIVTGAPTVTRLTVLVQREVGERLAAGPEQPQAYGAISAKLAYHAGARVVRHVPADVFWPRPSVGSVVVRIDRHTRPLVDVDEALLFRVIDASFAERRKTIRNGVRRLGFGAEEADRILVDADVAPGARPEELGVKAFARIAAALPA